MYSKDLKGEIWKTRIEDKLVLVVSRQLPPRYPCTFAVAQLEAAEKMGPSPMTMVSACPPRCTSFITIAMHSVKAKKSHKAQAWKSKSVKF